MRYNSSVTIQILQIPHQNKFEKHHRVNRCLAFPAIILFSAFIGILYRGSVGQSGRVKGADEWFLYLQSHQRQLASPVKVVVRKSK
jgi:hypothetical protein